jgi:myo-inositol 2-dehydrogenase / D-chiro-inositol 1-dehydrogenase
MTMKKNGRLFSRRGFLKTAGLAGAAAGVPLFVPARVFGAEAPSGRIRIGAIGCGRMGRGDMGGALNAGGDIIAVCDVDAHRMAEGRQMVLDFYKGRNRPAPEVTMYGDYREMLERDDLDAVLISTPDHWHARPLADAVRAGKHVYLQKPAGRIYHEGLAMMAAHKAHPEAIIQFGTQQRSSDQFRRACELVRNGRVGALKEVFVGLPIDPAGGNPAPMPVPEHLNYDAWLGWTPEVPYTLDRVHPVRGYDRPGWLRCEAYTCGMITGWGVHHMDIVHWGMDTERTGPVEVTGRATFPTTGLWSVHGEYDVELKYANGVTVKISDKYPNGIRFVGEEGWIFVSRGGQRATASDPIAPGADLKALDASTPELLAPMPSPEVALYRSPDHYRNWLECVREKKTPICPMEIGHRSSAVCNVAHIAMRLGRTLKFDPAAERFVGSDEANAELTKPMRPAYAV